ncbi:MAG TPA: sulfatase, partial [Puia sp.]|nr:sulfatase [Puia sp.]
MRSGMILSVLLIFLLSSGEVRRHQNNPAHPRPNILYIMSDDHACQMISAYGSAISKLAPTPNIDRLAKAGMLFQSAFVENSLCTPSRACLLTGLYSHQNGQRQLNEGIDTAKIFFTELLQKVGYQTGVVGKWHLRCEPKGFDDYRILNDQGEYYNPSFKSKSSNGKYIEQNGYATSLITDYAIDFLENRKKDQPFCLLVHHKAPHRNWMPETKYLDLYEDIDFPKPETFYDTHGSQCSAAHTQAMTIGKDMEMVSDFKFSELADSTPYNKELTAGLIRNELNRMDLEERKAWENAFGPKNKKFLEKHLQGEALLNWKYQRYIKDYLRCVKSVDDGVGRLLDYLEKEGLSDNTIVVYTSDQGFYMGEHGGWFDKRFMYEESFRMPLIICYPKTILPGTVSHALVQNIDFAPTFLSLAGIAKPKEMTG